MTDHFIEFTAVLGPIDPPFKLHTFDDEGNPVSTLHGELADRLREAAWEIDHDVDSSAKIVTEDEMQARADALNVRAARDELQEALDVEQQNAKALQGYFDQAVENAIKAEADRDRARAAFDRIALDPAEYRHALGHVADCDHNCEQCRDLARRALDGGVDAGERAADILNERNQLRAVMDAARAFAEAHRVWIAKATAGGVTPVDEESRRRVATLAALTRLVEQLDDTSNREGT